MGKANGGVEKDLSVTSTKGTTRMTRSTDLAYSSGRVGTATKESTETTREMAMEK